ncbi:MAG: hypothetical protein LM593_04885 [Candidatus Verstraetearchaeota archaeon]|nr:hypothetical protein [Candidatus Verstraetearchaeota archaeon]
MVKEVKRGEELYYICEECGLIYKEKIYAEKCEEFCSEYNACSIEITKHAIKFNKK